MIYTKKQLLEDRIGIAIAERLDPEKRKQWIEDFVDNPAITPAEVEHFLRSTIPDIDAYIQDVIAQCNEELNQSPV